ncbi:MAG: rhomboid family intramembrane serine protease [Porticoccaceae bacterium]|nr:MAG: rhomboid family intramembrane serine protease [Porticoccaceae bacterium]
MSGEFLRLAAFPASLDLGPLLDELERQGIAWRLRREGEWTVLYVDRMPEGALPGGAPRPPRSLRHPVTLALVALSLVGTAIPRFAFPWLHWFTFQDFALLDDGRIAFGTLRDALAAGEYWRLVTPAFLHFGIFHVAFNGLWLWEFGRRIEAVAGGTALLAMVLALAVASSLSQYLWSGPSLFGGMSGVVFGLLGYLWVHQRLCPRHEYQLPPGLVVLMVGWLLVCATGVVDLFVRGGIANAAHVGGLLAGAALGAVGGWRAAGRRRAAGDGEEGR